MDTTTILLGNAVSFAGEACGLLVAAKNWLHKKGAGVISGTSAYFKNKSPDQAFKEAVVRVMLTQTGGIQAVDNSTFTPTEYGMAGTVGNAVAAVGSTLGVAWTGVKVKMMRQPLLTGLPMAQALLLMGIYAFLPLVVFLSGFDLKALFLGSVAIFTVKTFASMLAIAQWVDTKLVESMFPNQMLDGMLKVVEFVKLRNPAVVMDGYKTAILDTLLVGLLVGLPMLWVSMMGWFGIQLNATIKSVMSAAESNAQKSAETSASAISTGTRMAVTRKPK